MSPANADVHCWTKVTSWGSFNLEILEKKGKVSCPAPRLWRHMVTVHKLFGVRVTQPRPAHEQLYAAAVFSWGFGNSQRQTTPCTDEPLVTLQGKLIPITVSS